MPLSASNIDPGQTYLYRSTNLDYGVTLELQVRVLGRSSRHIYSEVLGRRTFRTADQPPDWEQPSSLTLLQLPLQHTVDVVSVSALALAP
jgi:hypothetical protein